jgi:hypothetical protein
VLLLALPRHAHLLMLLLQVLLQDQLHALQHCLHAQDVRQQLPSLHALRLRLRLQLMLEAGRCSCALHMSLQCWHTALLVLAAARAGGAPPVAAAAAAAGTPYCQGRTLNLTPLV